LRIALGQFNASVGDISGNVEKMRDIKDRAFSLGADVLVFPEMSVCGYPPEDLLLNKNFLIDTRLAVEQMAADSAEMFVLVGFAETNERGCYNSLAVLQKGEIKKIYRKSILPNYGVFDERRYFKPGTEPATININGISAALTICEDVWHLEWLDKFFGKGPHKDLILNISASPFHIQKIKQRKETLRRCAKYFNCAVAYCNLVGGQDELVFDGRSMFLDSSGKVIFQAKAFEEDLLLADITPDDRKEIHVRAVKKIAETSSGTKQMDAVSEAYAALVLGTKNYVQKNHFSRVIIGLSGGIDSSLTAAIAVDALGTNNVVGITMPSKFNSEETIRDAKVLAESLDIEFHIIPIGPVLDRFSKLLGTVQGWNKDGIAYENLQARIRGTILMSLSNQFSYLVLTTSNKSEIAVGYSTLYGDTAGGFAVIKDVPKTMVYQLSEFVNKKHRRKIIPDSVIKRAPSAELRKGQKDSDSLPDYDLLDNILKGYIENDKSPGQLIAEGIPEEVVSRVVRMIDFNEYKRRQLPPGVKITPKAFGKDRRMPITNLYTAGRGGTSKPAK
jgi:NAD+ synthase (glutamine-hydrolysing)